MTITIFHGHLDLCTQCRENPWQLCVVGAGLLKHAAEIKTWSTERRCDVTANLCGTDTWAEGKSCECASCQAWLKTQQSTFRF